MNEYLYRTRITLADEASPPCFGRFCGMRCRQRFTAQLRWRHRRPITMSMGARTRVVDRPILAEPERSLMVIFALLGRPVGPERPGPAAEELADVHTLLGHTDLVKYGLGLLGLLALQFVVHHLELGFLEALELLIRDPSS